MKLVTREMAEGLPRLYSTENIKLNDKIVVMKFFLMNFTWFILEGDIEVIEQEEKDNKSENTDFDVRMFCYVQNHSDEMCSEFGYVMLTQLEEVCVKGIWRVERDLYFKPTKLSELIKRRFEE